MVEIVRPSTGERFGSVGEFKESQRRRLPSPTVDKGLTQEQLRQQAEFKRKSREIAARDKAAAAQSARQAAVLAATRTQTALRDRGTSQDRTLSREQRIRKLMDENRESGILPSRASATKVIGSRIRGEQKTMERSVFIEAGGVTGEVQAVGDRGVLDVIRSETTKTKTGRPTGGGIIADVAGRVGEVSRVTELKLFGERIEGAPTQAEQRAALKKGFPPVRVFEFGAEAIVRGGEFLGGLATGTSGRIEPKSRAITKQIIEDILVFQTFAPVIKTATAQQMESQFADTVVEVVYKGEKVKMTASQAKALGLTDTKEITRLQATTLFKTKTAAEQEQTLKVIFEKFNKITFISDTDKAASLKRIIDFMRQSGLTDAQIKARLATVFGQQAQTSTILITETTRGARQALLSQTTGVQLEQLPQVLTSVSLLQPSQVGETAFVTTTGLFQDSLSIQAQQKQGALQLFGPAQATTQKTRQAQTVRQLFGPAQISESAIAQDQITRQEFVPTTAQLFGQDFAQPQIPQQTQGFGQPTPQRPREPGRPPGKPIPLFRTSPAQRAVKQLAKQVKGDFEAFARVGGVDISIGKAKTLKKAAKKLSKKLKGTLSASGFIEEDGRKISARDTGLIDGDFRVSVLDTRRVVQRQSRRLGSGQETSEIQFFRKKSGGGNLFGSSVKKKRRSNSGFSFL